MPTCTLSSTPSGVGGSTGLYPTGFAIGIPMEHRWLFKVIPLPVRQAGLRGKDVMVQLRVVLKS